MKQILTVQRFLAVLALLFFLTSCSKGEEVSAQVRDAASEDTIVSLEELNKMTENLPENIRNGILDRPREFLEMIEDVLELPEEQVLLVDKNHALPSSYEPSDLVDLAAYDLYLNKEGMQLREVLMPDLLKMNEDASAAGLRLVLSSTYRSYDYQERVFQYHVDTIGEEQAKRESAEPGKSQHQLGTTIDFGSITPAFGNTEEGKWLKKNAWKYGFSLSYPENTEDITGYIHEIWHYRWLGRVCTRLERDFFNGIQQYMLEFLHENRSTLEGG